MNGSMIFLKWIDYSFCQNPQKKSSRKAYEISYKKSEVFFEEPNSF